MKKKSIAKYNRDSIDLECLKDIQNELGRVLLYRLKSQPTIKKVELNSLVKKKVSDELFSGKMEIRSGSNGAPFIVGAEGMHVSISHSGNYYAFYFSRIREIGIDLELDREIKSGGLNYFMNENEMAHVWSLDEILTIWCVKEAFLKMTRGKASQWKEAVEVQEIGINFAKALCNDELVTFSRIREEGYTIIYGVLKNK